MASIFSGLVVIGKLIFRSRRSFTNRSLTSRSFTNRSFISRSTGSADFLKPIGSYGKYLGVDIDDICGSEDPDKWGNDEFKLFVDKPDVSPLFKPEPYGYGVEFELVVPNWVSGMNADETDEPGLFSDGHGVELS